MFHLFADKFQKLVRPLLGQGKITEKNIFEVVEQVRIALTEADVNYEVASRFVEKVKDKSVGSKLLKSISPGDQFVKVVYDELIDLMGREESSISFSLVPTVIMLCGLQGSGKTTTAAKLAYFLKGKEYRKKVLVASSDRNRFAAIEQLSKLCLMAEVDFFAPLGDGIDSLQIAKESLIRAKQGGFEVLILDTAGRSPKDKGAIDELLSIKNILQPHEILFVANSATGQDAVNTAALFDQHISITGTVLTMLDGDNRGGAAISIKEVTQKPLKFEGVGEKLADFQIFNPRSMADRILGMGDIINLVKKAEQQFDEEQMQKLERKLMRSEFSYSDYLQQISAVKKMGSFSNLMGMVPAASHSSLLSETEMKKMEAIIFSMNIDEREERVEFIPSRRWRVAKGSGTKIDDVNRLVKMVKQMKLFFKHLPKKALQNPGSLKQLGGFLGKLGTRGFS